MNKRVGQKYRVLEDQDRVFKKGDIATLVEIESDKLSLYSNDLKGGTYYLWDVDACSPDVELVEDSKIKKYVGQRYKVISNDENEFEIGEIVKLVNIHSDKISLYENDSGRTEWLYDIDYEGRVEVELVDSSEVWLVIVDDTSSKRDSTVHVTYYDALRYARSEFERRYGNIDDTTNYVVEISSDLKTYDVYMQGRYRDKGFKIEIVPSRLYE